MIVAGDPSYSYTLDQRWVLTYSEKVVLFDQSCGFRRNAHGALREEGDPCPPSQPDLPNHPWRSMGNRSCNQITLTYVAYSFLKGNGVVELGEMGGQREGLGGVEGREIVIRIQYVREEIFFK